MAISPKILKGGIVLVDPNNSTVQKIIPLQYNPDTITRTLQVKGAGDGGNRSEALRLSGPPVETYKLDAELDATDQLGVANQLSVENGIQPHLMALEMIIYPRADQLISNGNIAQSGTLEILPMETALVLFIWSKNRIMPVRITDFSVTEEAFDVNLNPIRAKISLGMRVLSVDDLEFAHKGSGLYLAYQRTKERLAGLFSQGALSNLGINNI